MTALAWFSKVSKLIHESRRVRDEHLEFGRARASGEWAGGSASLEPLARGRAQPSMYPRTWHD
jgi:hypothetical protein